VILCLVPERVTAARFRFGLITSPGGERDVVPRQSAKQRAGSADTHSPRTVPNAVAAVRPWSDRIKSHAVSQKSVTLAVSKRRAFFFQKNADDDQGEQSPTFAVVNTFCTHFP